MNLKVLKVVLWVVLLLVLIESGLEVRAFLRGWDTLVFGPPRTAKLLRAAEPGKEFGPTDGFPFRSLVVPVEKKPGTTRYWIASASHAQDIYVEPDKIFPHLLTTELERRGRPSQVLNGSRDRFTIRDNLEQLRSLADRWRPDVVVLYHMSADISHLSRLHLSDPGSREQLRPGGREPAGVREEPEPSWVVKLSEQTVTYKVLKLNVTPYVSQSRILHDHLGAKAEAAFEGSVTEFVDLCESLGATPVLCTFATSHDRRHRGNVPRSVVKSILRFNLYLSVEGWMEAVERLNAVLRRVAHRRGVLLVDLQARLGGRSESFRDFVHFTLDGHRIVAETIAEALVRGGVSSRGGHVRPGEETR